MSKGSMTGIVCLFLALFLVAGLSLAEGTETPEVVVEEVKIEAEDQALPEDGLESDDTKSPGEFESPAADTDPGLTCTCDCVCPSSGASQTQTFPVPAWIASCSQFNGNACSVKFDTCNTPRRYQSCRF